MLENMIPISLTPFHQDGSLDHESIPTLMQFYLRNQASAVIVLGIMGEAHALSDRERELVIEHYVSASHGKVPIIATISSPATEVAIERARQAQDLGASALMIAPPPGVNDPLVLMTHFERIAWACDLPWVLQDEPSTTGVKLSPHTIAQFARNIKSLVAVKVEEIPSASKIDALHQLIPHVQVFGGLGGLYLFEELCHGAAGSMTGFSYPNLLAQMMNYYRSEDSDTARAMFYRYLPLIRYEAQLGVRGIAIRKALFLARGLISTATVRAPSAAVDPIIEADLINLVSALGLSLGTQESSI